MDAFFLVGFILQKQDLNGQIILKQIVHFLQIYVLMFNPWIVMPMRMRYENLVFEKSALQQ